MNRYTKVNDRTLTDALIPFEHKTVEDGEIPRRVPFGEKEHISMTFDELVQIVSTAREFGVLEGSGGIAHEYLRSIGLLPLHSPESFMNMKNGKLDDAQAERWISY